MALELINATIVIVAQDHNPSILHPSFLVSTSVVPPDFELADSPISTPAFSRVVYKNGLSFQAEPDRINIVDGRPPEDPAASALPNYAAKYVGTLPHVPYRAVGINFTTIVLDQDPRMTIIRRFLRDGPWNDAELPAQGLGIKLVYGSDPGVLHLNIDAGSIRRASDGSTATGILVQANYHTDVQDEARAREETVGFIRLFPDRWKDCQQKVARIFGAEQ